MNESEVQDQVLRMLIRIAPDIAPEEIEPAVNFRDQVELDSMDFLNLVTAIHEQLGVNIPEVDYPKLSSLNGCVKYIRERLD